MALPNFFKIDELVSPFDTLPRAKIFTPNHALTDTSTTGFTGFVKFDRDRRAIEAWSMSTPFGAANRIIDLLEQADGSRGTARRIKRARL